MQNQSTLYKLMRQAELMDDDGPDLEEATRDESDGAAKFKQKYKDFYTDIKISIKEDW